MKDLIQIDGVKIGPGEQKDLNLLAARLPSGTEITMPIHVYRSKNPGPKILLSGGMHGDEVNGIEIVRRVLGEGLPKRIRCGSIIAMPIINVYGFINFARYVPDGKDINRSFPGREDGSLASRVAHLMTRMILPEIDFGIDFHTGGASRTNYPQIRFEEGNSEAEELAKIFAAPFTLSSSLIKGSFRETAKDLGKPVIVFEGGETLRLDPKTVDEGLAGVKRVLQHYKMLSSAPKPGKSISLDASTWVRAEVSGLFRHKKSSGARVKEGKTIGYISAPTNEYSVKVKAPSDGYIIGHNNFPLVHKGDALFHLGFSEK